MSYNISTLLTRNLHDVFGENDHARRRVAIDEIFTEDCVFYEPRGVYRGRDEIEGVAGAIKATHPDFRYQPITGPEELGNAGRVQWVSGRPGEAPEILRFRGSFCLKAQNCCSLFTDSTVLGWRPVVAARDLELPSELYLTTQVESSTRMSLRKSSFIILLGAEQSRDR
jgi:hypothetical protein